MILDRSGVSEENKSLLFYLLGAAGAVFLGVEGTTVLLHCC